MRLQAEVALRDLREWHVLNALECLALAFEAAPVDVRTSFCKHLLVFNQRFPQYQGTAFSGSTNLYNL